ncbi:MAG TPA: helix-turn-helix domain-containing protein [Actinomycetota bacterium]|nr:helix-turn-helix domain-containing protein [Actinomycetota bacterium]
MATAKKGSTGTRVHGRPDNVGNGGDDIVSVDEVARRLGVPKTTLYGWRYKGVGPRSHRVGKHLRYRWNDVLEWLDGLE